MFVTAATVDSATSVKPDVPATEANIDSIVDDLGYHPKTDVNEGIAKFVSWYRDYYKISF